MQLVLLIFNESLLASSNFCTFFNSVFTFLTRSYVDLDS